ncbi:tetratricopeptide repeat protein [Propionivibrio limicola]|uniref:tetratricopeptide repeat protein n=1 Tax=Propionivibrio limicola TaxID=167645 RepID=UPI0014782175|nr:tetratricopeptide repeat protein [Propionivibrio limicola]
MSLVNQMLRDLDARRAATDRKGLLDNVRPLPPLASRRSRVWLISLGCLVVISAFWIAYSFMGPGEAAAIPSLLNPPLPTTKDGSDDVRTHDDNLSALALSLRMSDVIGAEVPVPQEAVDSRQNPAPAAKVSEIGKEAAPLSQAEPSGAVKESVPEQKARDDRHADTPGKTVVIEKAESSSPKEKAEAEYRKSMTALNQGQTNDALELLRGALRLDASHVAARQWLVKLLLDARRLDEAVVLLQEGIALRPAQVGWAMTLARLQVERGSLADAWKTLESSLPAGGDNADYQGFAGHVLYKQGRSRDAIAHYQVATRLAPADGRWWLGLGLALEAEGKLPEARDMFLRARQTGKLGPDLTALVEQKVQQFSR